MMNSRQITSAEVLIVKRWADWAEFLINNDMSPLLRTCDKEGLDPGKVMDILTDAIARIRTEAKEVR